MVMKYSSWLFAWISIALFASGCLAGSGSAPDPVVEAATKATTEPALPTETALPTKSPSRTPTVAPPTPDTIVPEGLVAFFDFSGNAQDRSGWQNHGSVLGAQLAPGLEARPDEAYAFDGQSAYIEIPDSKSLDLTFRMSISIWLYYVPQAEATFYTLLEKSDPERGGHSRWGMWLINDLAEFCIQPADLGIPQRCLDSASSLTPNSWHHITGTYDGTVLHIYLDGQLDNTLDQYSGQAISQSDHPLFIGTDLFNDRVIYLDGAIDEIRIYKRALDAAEIQALYAAGPE
jgi:hypothetical protein